jgi:glucose-6-phosphate isomerase
MARHEEYEWRQTMRIRLDYTNMLAESIGPDRGTTQEQIDEMQARFTAALDVMRMRRSSNDLAWPNLPHDTNMAKEILDYASEAAGKYDDILVLGIGGSALGVTALKTALLPSYTDYESPETRQHPRLFVLDNIDPDWFARALQMVRPERTLVIVTSKSGATTETMAQFLIVREWLRQALGADYAGHVVAITDPEKGELRAIATREGYRTFPVPAGVGGRYSVLSPVGLLPAALVGIDIQELLAGAAYGDEVSKGREIRQNPAGLNAALQHLAYMRGQRISVMMPYSMHLRDVADWFRQLWAESLGKKMSIMDKRVNIGPTPVLALGPTDQHSQIQLYMEGPADKVVNFVMVERFTEQEPIPPASDEEKEIRYLGGHTLAELINVEREATAVALTEEKRPNCTYILPEVNAFTVGELLYMLEMQTAISGLFYAVDAYNQPGVEAGKQATYALMDRPGYEGRAVNIRMLKAAREHRLA